MDVKFDMDDAGSIANEYGKVISALRDHTSMIRDTYESLSTASWSGAAERSFLAKYNGEKHVIWEKLIQQLEDTRDAITEIAQTAEPIQSKSESLM